jgi:hypothetical protein
MRSIKRVGINDTLERARTDAARFGVLKSGGISRSREADLVSGSGIDLLAGAADGMDGAVPGAAPVGGAPVDGAAAVGTGMDGAPVFGAKGAVEGGGATADE